MSARRPQAGFTLAELLIGLAIAAIVLAPLADMLRAGADSARTVRTGLDANAEVRFALDRIAARAAISTAPAPGLLQPITAILLPSTANASAADNARAWLAPMRYTLDGGNLVESDGNILLPQTSVIATNVTSFEVEAPVAEPGWRPLLRIALTLDPVATGCGERCVVARSVRLGANP